MSYEHLFKYSAGNNDGAEQNGDVIINIDTDDVDGNGLPMDTSEVPEGDIAVSQEEVAVAEESAAGAEDAGETATDLNELSGELNSFLERGQALTQTDVNYLAKLSYMAQRRNFPGASRSMLVRASLGAGLNDAAGNIEWVVSALNENETGVVANIKAFIKKIVDFFKGIFNAIKTWISGSKKLQGRAEEIIKRAGKTDEHAATATGNNAKVNMGGVSSKLATTGNFSIQNVSRAVGILTAKSKEILTDGKAITVVGELANKLNQLNAKSTDADFKGVATKTASELQNNVLGSGSTGRSGIDLIGGLQVGVLTNAEEYSFKAFANVTAKTETPEFPTLALKEVAGVANMASELLDIVVSYQDGWKKRDEAKAAVVKQLEANAKPAIEEQKKQNDAKAKDDDTKQGMFKGFMHRRKMGNAAGQTLLSIQMMENKLIGHDIAVASALLTYCTNSLNALAAEKKGVDAKAKKNPATPATP